MVTQLTVMEGVTMSAQLVGNEWTVTIACAEGRQFRYQTTVTWSTLQYAAVCALMLGWGEESDSTETTDALYAVAEPLFEGLPRELRLIP